MSWFCRGTLVHKGKHYRVIEFQRALLGRAALGAVLSMWLSIALPKKLGGLAWVLPPTRQQLDNK